LAFLDFLLAEVQDCSRFCYAAALDEAQAKELLELRGQPRQRHKEGVLASWLMELRQRKVLLCDGLGSTLLVVRQNAVRAGAVYQPGSL
jgi:hypothetical protein